MLRTRKSAPHRQPSPNLPPGCLPRFYEPHYGYFQGGFSVSTQPRAPEAPSVPLHGQRPWLPTTYPMKQDVETFCPTSRQHWREWLHAHHATRPAVWLVYYKKQSGTSSLTWSEAVDEALCYGWIDSRAMPIDAATYRQFFGPRKASSPWSKVNKAKVARLTAAGQMQPAGLAAVAAAQRNGAWTLLDEVEELLVPPDLAQLLRQQPGAEENFAALSRTDRRYLLQWLVLARRPDTRQRRLAEIVALAAQGLKPAQLAARQWADTTKKAP